MTRQDAIKKAKEIYEARLNEEVFPEDEWRGLSRDWDLNLFTEDGKPHVSIYPVDDTGRTEALDEIAVI